MDKIRLFLKITFIWSIESRSKTIYTTWAFGLCCEFSSLSLKFIKEALNLSNNRNFTHVLAFLVIMRYLNFLTESLPTCL